MELLEVAEGLWDVAGEVVEGEVEFLEREVGESVRDIAGEEVEGEIKMAESGASGDGSGESGVKVIVREREMGKMRETAEGNGERTGEIGVREVDGGDGVGEIVAKDAGPVARR